VVAVVEGLEDGYHYGFIVTFAMPQARDAYLNDPNHRPVAEAIVAPLTESSSSTSDPA
jgi:Stress responsive A/B Barrel Domain